MEVNPRIKWHRDHLKLVIQCEQFFTSKHSLNRKNEWLSDLTHYSPLLSFELDPHIATEHKPDNFI